jgi:hypothetical protein
MRSLAPALLLGLALTGCAKDAPKAAPAPSPSATTASPTPTPAPSATPSPTATATPLTDLADGRQYVYAKSIDTAGRTIVVDVVQFLTGKAAEDAAKEDGKEVDNDYYVRNANARLRTLTFADDVPIVVNTLTAEETGDATKDTTITPAKFGAYFDSGDAQQRLYYLTLSGGVVVKINEQFLP